MYSSPHRRLSSSFSESRCLVCISANKIQIISSAIIPEVLDNKQLNITEEISLYISELQNHYDCLRNLVAVASPPVGRGDKLLPRHRGPYQVMEKVDSIYTCLLYTSPSPRDRTRSRMPSSA